MAANADLWKRLLAACGTHRVEFVWVKGHAGNPESERADALSTLMLKRSDLPPDEGYDPNRQRACYDAPPLFP